MSGVVNLQSKTVARGADDPGQTSFAGIRARNLAAIRLAVLRVLGGG